MEKSVVFRANVHLIREIDDDGRVNVNAIILPSTMTGQMLMRSSCRRRQDEYSRNP